MPIIYLLLSLALSWSPRIFAQGYIETLKVENLTLPTQTASRVPYLDSNKKLVSSSTTDTQLGYLGNATSNLCGINQSCTLTNKTLTSPSLTGTIGIGVSASRVLVSDGSSNLVASSVTSTTLGYLDISSSLTTLLAAKAPTASPTFTGSVNIGTTAGAVISSAGGVLSSEAQLNPARGGTGINASASSGLLKFTIGTPSVSSGQVVNADVAAAAGIGVTKLEALTASRPVITDASGFLTTEATLAVSRGGTGLASYTAGDLLYASGSTTLAAIGIGTSGHVLTSNGSTASWAASPSGFANPMTTNGDIIIRSAGVPARLGIGTTNQVLAVSSALPAWVDPSVSSSAAGAQRIERAQSIASCTASPCTLATSTAGISSVTRTGAGSYTINFAASTFSAVPTCVVMSSNAGGNTFAEGTSPGSWTASAVTFATLTGFAAVGDTGFSIICMGPR